MAYVSAPFLITIAVLVLSACGGAETQAPQATLDQSAIDAQAAASIAARTDKTGPEIINVSASTSRITAPNSVSLSASVRDLNSGVLKVEFYKVGVRNPIDIKTSPPYTTSIPLGVADQGTNSYYIKAYDMAVNWLGLLEPNTSDSVKSPTTISVDIPTNTLKYGGSLKDILGPTATTNPETIQVGALLNNAVSGSRFYIVGNPTTAMAGYGSNTIYEIDYALKSIRATKLPDDAQNGYPGRNLLATDPSNFSRLLFISNSPQYMAVYPTTNKPIFESRDAGLSWNKISEIRSGVFPAYQYLKFAEWGKAIFAHTDEDGGGSSGSNEASTGTFARSFDEGLTWSYAPSGLSTNSGTSLIRSAATEGKIYLKQGIEFYTSSNLGSSFLICGRIPNEYFGPSGNLEVSPSNPLSLIFSPSSTVILRSEDGCSTWSPITLPPLPQESPTLTTGSSGGQTMFRSSPRKIIYSKHIPGLIYIIGTFGKDGGALLRSTDGGLTWSIRSYFDPTSRGATTRYPPREAIITNPNNQGDIDIIILTKADEKINDILRSVEKVIVVTDNISQP
jgi:hypothetical protein